MRASLRSSVLIPSFVAAALAAGASPATGEPRAVSVDIPFEQFTLPSDEVRNAGPR